MLRYSDLTQTQKDAICNGCGAKSGWIPVPNFLFKASCNHHDFYYWRGGDESDREEADDAFYKYMRVDIEDQNHVIKFRAYYHFWALSYYLAVRYFGKQHFEYRDEMKTIKDI